MAYNFDKLPTSRPGSGGSSLTPGQYGAVVEEAIIKPTKDGARTYLATKLKLDNGKTVFYNLSRSQHDFVLYQLGRLLHACDIKLSGNFELDDLAKLLPGKTMKVDIEVNDRGYGDVSFNDGNEGFYPLDKATPEQEEEIDATLANAVDSVEDEDDF